MTSNRPISPYLADPDVTLYQGDALTVLRELPAESVHCIATSPPFYALRDYGVEGQIGLEPTPEEWAQRLVEVFREARRVLRRDGTLWVEIGDSYCANVGGHGTETNMPNAWKGKGGVTPMRHPTKPKDLLGQPWLLAFALRADGWYLRSEIIWARPNPMPESVTDRPTKAHSTVFLLSKSPRYFYDQEAIREAFAEGHNGRMGPNSYGRIGEGGFKRVEGIKFIDKPQTETLDGSEGEAPRGPDGRRVTHVEGGKHSEQHRSGERWPASGANARSVWTIPTEPTPFKHFATWPQALCRRMILAGTSERGVCPECGAPWLRETSIDYTNPGNRSSNGRRTAEDLRDSGVRTMAANRRLEKSTSTLGWRPFCDHDAEPVPATVLDCFAGSGTTGLVARKLGRHAVLIELSESYCALTADRLAQQSLLAEVPSGF